VCPDSSSRRRQSASTAAMAWSCSSSAGIAVTPRAARLQAGSRVRLSLGQHLPAPEGPDDGEQQARAASTREGSFSSEALRSVVGALLAGQCYTSYSAAALGQGLRPMSSNSFVRYVSRIQPVVQELCCQTMELLRYAAVRYGDPFTGETTIDRFVVASSSTTAKRGRPHGSKNYALTPQMVVPLEGQEYGSGSGGGKRRRLPKRKRWDVGPQPQSSGPVPPPPPPSERP